MQCLCCAVLHHKCHFPLCSPRSVFRFRVDPFEECSVTCGGGLQSRFVACEKRLQFTSADPADINETVVANVSDSNCIRAGRRVPARVQRCNVGVPCPIWIAEPFGLVSFKLLSFIYFIT